MSDTNVKDEVVEAKELTLTAEDLAQLIDEAVEKAVKPLADEAEATRKAILPADEVSKEIGELEGNEKVAKWLEALAKGDTAVIKQLSEGVGADGGFTVPTEFRAIVVEKMIKLSIMRPVATTIPMSRNKLEVPTEGAAVVATWTAENAPQTESNPDFGQVVLDTNKLTGLAKMSRELLADSAINIVSYVAERFARAFQIAEDSAFTVGTGAGQPKGFTTYTFTSIAQAGANLVADDLIALFYKLPVQYRNRAVWVLHNDIILAVRKLKDTQGRYLWTDGLNEAPATILGRPVLEQNDFGTGSIYVGDFSYYLIGDRQTMEVEQSTEAGDAFINHQLWLKVVERLDGQLAQTDPIVELTAVVA